MAARGRRAGGETGYYPYENVARTPMPEIRVMGTRYDFLSVCWSRRNTSMSPGCNSSARPISKRLWRRSSNLFDFFVWTGFLGPFHDLGFFCMFALFVDISVFCLFSLSPSWIFRFPLSWPVTILLSLSLRCPWGAKFDCTFRAIQFALTVLIPALAHGVCTLPVTLIQKFLSQFYMFKKSCSIEVRCDQSRERTQ